MEGTRSVCICKEIMLTMKIIISISAALLAATTIAEQYRLKFPATVDIIEDGSVIGTKKLKAGTVLELAAKTDTDVKTPTSGTRMAPGRSGRLTPSNISPAMFKNEGKPKTTLRAEIELGSSYYGQFETKKSTHWNIYIAAKNADWSYGERLDGYIPKSSPLAKRLIAAIEDGRPHRCLIKVSPVKDEIHDDLVTIDDFEILPPDPETL